MYASREDLINLIALSKADRVALAAQKKLDELPQRAQILAARKKRASILEKQQSVAEMRKSAEQEFAKISDEDAMLADKQSAVQATINSVHGDFRSVEAHTKELNGLQKRRSALDTQLEQVDARLEKIKAVEAQIETILSQIQVEEDAAVESFRAEGGELKAKVASAQASAAQYASTLPDELVKLYQKTAKKCAGVALGVLEGNKCSVCRSSIDESHLIDLKASRPLGVCPSCKRLLITDPPIER
ncbi:MAG: hypothetical protein IJJ32_03055 [Eggerthellaceae bacterium]|nr:hypothetical protein [Eggerthellaceae bacterium]